MFYHWIMITKIPKLVGKPFHSVVFVCILVWRFFAFFLDFYSVKWKPFEYVTGILSYVCLFFSITIDKEDSYILIFYNLKFAKKTSTTKTKTNWNKPAWNLTLDHLVIFCQSLLHFHTLFQILYYSKLNMVHFSFLILR